VPPGPRERFTRVLPRPLVVSDQVRQQLDFRVFKGQAQLVADPADPALDLSVCRVAGPPVRVPRL
jgi:hypothetical protein